jgi:hypothetical protein
MPSWPSLEKALGSIVCRSGLARQLKVISSIGAGPPDRTWCFGQGDRPAVRTDDGLADSLRHSIHTPGDRPGADHLAL